MLKAIVVGVSVLSAHVAAAPAATEEVEATEVETETGGDRRELFPVYSIGNKCARRGCSVYNQITSVNPRMAIGDEQSVKGPIKTLEMLALNDDLNTVVQSSSFCTRRNAMARAAGLAAGLSMAAVNKPGFAAADKVVKMGSDNGQLVFVPDEISICKGDSITWMLNKAGPHNVVFDEEAVPSGVDSAKISKEEQMGEDGDKFTQKFDVAGSYEYYCEPHRGAGMNGALIVS
jgi:plastocyanin